MKKWLIILIMAIFVTAASASLVTFEPVNAGDWGSVENPIEAGDLYDIYIIVEDEAFFAIDVVVSVDGAAEIVSATGKANAIDFGWDVETSNDPIIGFDSVEIGLAVMYDQKFPGRAAKITLKALDEGQVNFSIAEGTSFDESTDGLFKSPEIAGQLAVYQATPEPMTIVLFAIGGICLKRRNT